MFKRVRRLQLADHENRLLVFLTVEGQIFQLLFTASKYSSLPSGKSVKGRENYHFRGIAIENRLCNRITHGR